MKAMIQNSKFRPLIFPGVMQARPLTLQEVLRLRDGLELSRNPGYPALAFQSEFFGKNWMVLSLN